MKKCDHNRVGHNREGFNKEVLLCYVDYSYLLDLLRLEISKIFL